MRFVYWYDDSGWGNPGLTGLLPSRIALEGGEWSDIEITSYKGLHVRPDCENNRLVVLHAGSRVVRQRRYERVRCLATGASKREISRTLEALVLRTLARLGGC